MFTNPAKHLFGTAALVAATAVVYAVLTGDRMGIALLAAVCAASFGLGVLLAGRPPAYPRPGVAAGAGVPGATVPLPSPVGPVAPAPSAWPFAVALTVVLVLVGLAVDLPLAGVGLGAIALAGAGWVVQAARERVLGRPLESTREVRTGVALVVGGGLLVVFARVLAGVPKEAAAPIAIVAAIGSIVAVFFLLSRPRVSLFAAILMLTGVLCVAIGLGGLIALASQRHVRPGQAATAIAVLLAISVAVGVFTVIGRSGATLVRGFATLLVAAVTSVALGTLVAAALGPRKATGRQAAPAAATVSGKAVFSANCAVCHGAQGQGGVGPALKGGGAKLTFPNVADHVNWVKTGSAALAGQKYGDPNRPGGQRGPATGGMPAFSATLTDAEIQAVVAYERDQL